MKIALLFLPAHHLVFDVQMPSTIDLDQSDPVSGNVDATVPVIRASELLCGPDHILIDTVRTACLETGFFYIQPSSIEQEVINQTLGHMETFFAIDDKDPRKTDIRQVDGKSGWQPKFTEPAYQPGTISSVEAYDFRKNEIESKNTLWPAIDGFQHDVVVCWETLLRLADKVLEILALTAGIEADFLALRCGSRALNSMRLLNYAGDAIEPSDASVGISAHTDFECVTLLYQSAPGLELRTVDGHWLDAASGTGHIVVMLDDMLERWTNGYFKATGHRVRKTNRQRFSIVMFVAVDEGLTIAPLEKFITNENPTAYEPITQEEHLENEIRRARENATRL